jgi:hypothetical protein
VLAQGFFQDLVFENADKPLQVSTSGGKTKVSWELGGWPADVELFFDRLHESGKAKGQTLANLLDVRENPTTEPKAASLPGTINPLKFLCENVLRGSAWLVQVKPDGFGPDALGLAYAPLLRKVIPAQTLMILVATLAGQEPAVTMNGTGGEDEPGFDSGGSIFIAKSNQDTIGPQLVGEQVTVRQIGGRCI